jgi:hypothetical protein
MATQSERVLRFLQENPGATVMDIQRGSYPYIANCWARISDLRAKGYQIDPVVRKDGHTGFVVVEKPVQAELGLAS